MHTKQAAYSNNHKWLPFAIPFRKQTIQIVIPLALSIAFPILYIYYAALFTHDACFLTTTSNRENGNHWVTCMLCELVSVYQIISFGINVPWNKMRKMFVSIRCVELLLFLSLLAAKKVSVAIASNLNFGVFFVCSLNAFFVG